MPWLTADRDAPTLGFVARRAKMIEDAGFDSIWIGDTISRGLVWPDPLQYLLAAAAGTKHIEVGTAVIQVPLRQPVDLAQRFLTMHALTGGRFSAGVGAGSTKADYDACGLNFDHRFKMLREHLTLIRALMRGQQVGEANLHPWPATVGGPPMYMGTWASGPWLKRAAQEYDGWLASGTWTTYKTFAEGLQKYKDLGGKRAIIATVYIDLKAEDSELTEDTPFNLRCGPRTAAERLQRLAEIGYDDCLLVKHGSHTEADLAEEDLLEIRSLLPKSNLTPQPPLRPTERGS